MNVLHKVPFQDCNLPHVTPHLFITSQSLVLNKPVSKGRPRGKTSTWTSCPVDVLPRREVVYIFIKHINVVILSLSTNTDNFSQQSYLMNCYFDFIEYSADLVQLFIVCDANIIRNAQNTFPETTYTIFLTLPLNVSCVLYCHLIAEYDYGCGRT